VAATGGRSGSENHDAALVTARPRTLPAASCGAVTVRVSIDHVDLTAEQVVDRSAAAAIGHAPS